MLHWMCSTLDLFLSWTLSLSLVSSFCSYKKNTFGSWTFWTFLSGLDLYQFLVTKPYCREEVAQTSMWKLLITDRIRVTSPIKSACHLSSLYFFLPWCSCSLRNPPSLHLFALWARFNISYEFKKLERKVSKERMVSISFKECCLLGQIWKAAQCRWANLCPVARERCHAWAAPCVN